MPVWVAIKKDRCAIHDDFDTIFAKMKESDGIIFGKPALLGSATANIKFLIDRAGFVCRQGKNFFYRKVGAPIW